MIQEQLNKLKEEKASIESENADLNKKSFSIKVLIKGNEKRLKLINDQIEELNGLQDNQATLAEEEPNKAQP